MGGGMGHGGGLRYTYIHKYTHGVFTSRYTSKLYFAVLQTQYCNYAGWGYGPLEQVPYSFSNIVLQIVTV